MIERNNSQSQAQKVDNQQPSNISPKFPSISTALNRDQQIQVIKWCVELRTNQEIAKLVLDDFNITMSSQAVWKYRQSKKWRPLIIKLRTKFEANILKIPIANKVYRLKYLQEIMKAGLSWSLKTVTKDGEEIYELKLGAATQAIKEARVEVEGEKALVENHYHITAEDLNQARERANAGLIKQR